MVDEATIQIREAARELSRYLETLDIDPARQEEVERRLAAVEELSRKHRVPAAELAGRAATLEKELAELDSADNNLNALKKAAGRSARGLSQARHAAFRRAPDQRRARFPKTSPRACRRSAWPAAASSSTSRSRMANRPRMASTPWNFASPPTRASRCARSPKSPRAASSRACRSRCRSPAPRRTRAAWCSTKSTPASAARSPKSSAANSRRWVSRARRSASRTCRRWPAQGHHHLRVSKLTDGKTTRTTHLRTHHGRTRRRNRAHARRHGNHRQSARTRARNAADGGQPGSEGAQRKAQGLSGRAARRSSAVLVGLLSAPWTEGQPGLRQWPYSVIA